MDGLRDLLQTNGYRFTKKRSTIYEILSDHKKEHLNIHEILSLAKDRDPSIGIATIYRTMGIFTDLGLIYCVGDKYELIDESFSQVYPHFYCRECRSVVHVGEPVDIKDKVLRDAEAQDFHIDYISLNISGVCKTCRGK